MLSTQENINGSTIVEVIASLSTNVDNATGNDQISVNYEVIVNTVTGTPSLTATFTLQIAIQS